MSLLCIKCAPCSIYVFSYCKIKIYTFTVSFVHSFACMFSLDIPVKVVGILPQRNERGMLLKMAYALFERLSVYRYGRIELNLFISEREYKVKHLIRIIAFRRRIQLFTCCFFKINLPLTIQISSVIGACNNVDNSAVKNNLSVIFVIRNLWHSLVRWGTTEHLASSGRWPVTSNFCTRYIELGFVWI